jgi:triosephosphate isomerase
MLSNLQLQTIDLKREHMRKLFIAGNWKMNYTGSQTETFCREFKAKGLEGHKVDILLSPSFTSLSAMAAILGDTPVHIAGQNMCIADRGAFTGAISAEMLLDAKCSHVLLGHSERRQYFHESNEGVNLKTKQALKNGLTPIICIGETKEERESQITEEIVKTQLLGALADLSNEDILKTVIAYEPVWAIGTGLTASPEQAQEVHRFIRTILEERSDVETAEQIRLLYGGSAKPTNAESLLSEKDIDGLLIGGASLKVDDFFQMIETGDKLSS